MADAIHTHSSDKITPESSSDGNTVTSSSDSLLQEALYPEDSYQNGVYWADLPAKERHSWIKSQSLGETKREIYEVGRMAKADPLSPIAAYFRKYVSAGMGLFVEGYVLFSIGNLSALFAAAWPQCFVTHEVCSKTLVQSITYMEIVGIILGQILVGIQGDFIGRKFGLVQDAIIMFIGVMLLTSIWGTSLQGWVAAYMISLFFYGIGVGGEYPMTSTRALEQGVNGPAGTRDDRLHRGRNVVLAFTMQGWGQAFNQGILILLLVIFHGGSVSPPFSPKLAQYTYRVSFGLIAILHLWLVYYRVYKVKDADVQLRRDKKKLNTSGYDIKSLQLGFSHYGGRLMATAVGWFANDFFFYGNKIFASVFIRIIKPGASLVTTWEYNLLNIGVSLVGYYMAAFFIDSKFYGRRKMQQVSFFVNFMLYLFAAIFFNQLEEAGTNIKIFQAIYFISSFFTQFGMNCVSFLVAAECFPSSIRSSSHGFAAACGKLGALAPTILYNYIPNHTKFWVIPWFGLIGFVLTFFFLPDTTGLDLREQERYWRCVRAGRAEDYHGIAVHRRHLSWWEVHVLHRDQHYDAELDKQDRIDELRVLYESHLIAKEDETGGSDDIDHAFVSPDVARYFEKESFEGKVKVQSKKERALKEKAPEVRMKSALNEELEKSG